ncbi:MAG: hypothetical protein M5U26_09015 [Planctomycetota bacterium]|nr:hypothetical protein [Planctomycetota bacterium]
MSPAARDVVRRCKPYAAALAGLGAALGLIYGATGEPPWLTAPGLGLLAAAASAAVFLLGLALLRALLSLGWPPLAVARTVLDEALRMRIAVVFILMLLALLTLLPLTLDPGSPLRYRVQSFLSFSLGAAETLLCLMTIFLACGTLCDEIADRRIYTIATKPIGRGAYLLGKWLGLLLLNLLLLAVTGLSIFGFARLLAVQPALDAEDAAAVQEQILTARRTVRPAPPEGLDAEIERRLAEIAEKDPEFLAEQGRGRLARQVGHQALLNARSLSPHQRVSFTFENLGEAARSAGELQLRFKFRASKATDDGKLALRMALNGREQLVRPSIDTFTSGSFRPEPSMRRANSS